MPNKIIWTAKALEDMLSIKEYIAQDNPEASVKLSQKIVLKVVELLTSFKNIGRAGRINNTREIIIPYTPYIVVYRVKNETVEVLRVLHTSMI